jgi:uncharacterized OsmC-like protein
MMSNSPPLTNGLNTTAIKGAMAKMGYDETFGAKAPTVISAVWEKGVVRDVNSLLVCHPPPEISKNGFQHPSVYDYCPVMSSGCISLVYMMQAAERGMQLDSFKMDIETVGDVSCFFKKSAGGRNPWPEGLTLDLSVKGPQSEDELKELGAVAHDHCPAAELLRRKFPVEITDIKYTQVETSEEVYYDMDKYKYLSEQDGPVLVQQASHAVWYCHNESKEHPGALMEFNFGKTPQEHIILSHDKPIASGNYANPVQACFFGGLATHMHTIAARLYALGYSVKSIKGDIKTIMNKRVVMAVDKGLVFPSGGTMNFEIESDAPKHVFDQVQLEALEMSPAFMTWSHPIAVRVNVKKE